MIDPGSMKSRYPGITPGSERDRAERWAFTLLELLVVIGIVGLLAGLLLPALSRSKEKARGIKCLGNVKQLLLGWKLYADDHDGELVPNIEPPNGTGGWVQGWMDYSGSTANTNTAFLVDPQFAGLGLYLENARIFKCPSDRSTATINGQTHPRVRSYAMSNAMGDPLGGLALPSPPYQTYMNMADIVAPSPDRAFVFLDEHPDSINNGVFGVFMADPSQPQQNAILDYPGSYHNGGSNLGFADGHAETHIWLDARTRPPIRGTPLQLGVYSPNNVDVQWLSTRTSALSQ